MDELEITFGSDLKLSSDSMRKFIEAMKFSSASVTVLGKTINSAYKSGYGGLTVDSMIIDEFDSICVADEVVEPVVEIERPEVFGKWA